MKRVVNGKTYNTATAETVAVSEYTYEKRFQGPEWRCVETLYRTPKGAWFVVEEEWLDNDQVTEYEREVRTNFKVLKGIDAAITWVQKHEADLLVSTYFPDFEEA